jgi:hypothetical protein
MHLRSLIIQVLQSCGLRLFAIFFIRYVDGYRSGRGARRRDTLYLRWAYQLRTRFHTIEDAKYMLILLKLASKDVDMSATLSRAFPGDHIINLWRLIVVIWYIIIRVILIVQCEIDTGHSDAVKGCWCHACHFGRVDQPSRRLHIQIGEDAEGVIGIIDDGFVDKGVHRAALEDDLVTTLLWPIVGLKFSQNGLTVVPVVDHVARLLLLVQRDGESDWLVRVV